MEVRRPTKGDYLDHDTEGGSFRYYYTDEKLYLLNPTGLTYYDKRIGEQMPGYPAYYATSLITTNNSLQFGSWNLYVHPKIQQQIKNEHPLMDSNSVVRFSFWPSGNINFYYVGGETKWLPFGIYYARKNWIEAEWVTSAPNNLNNFVYGVDTINTYIKNITVFSGEYYPKYLAYGVETVSPQVAVKAGQNILVNSQTNTSENGVYRVNTGAWVKLSQPIYPAVVMVWGYAVSQIYSNSPINYIRGAGSDRNFLQTSASIFLSSFVGTGYPASHGFYLYHTLADALANTNQITYALVNSTENVNTDPLVVSIDENNVQHSNKPDYLAFSPIDYTYQSFKLLKGIGCCDQSYVDIVTSDIPDNMSFTFMGQGVSLKRFSQGNSGEIVTEAEATAYNATHSRQYDWPPLRYSYYQDGTIWYKSDGSAKGSPTSGSVYINIFQSPAYYQGLYYAFNRVGNIGASMFGGQVGIELKSPSNTITAVPFGNGNYTYKQSEGRTGTYPYEPWVYHDHAGRLAFFWAVDLNMIMVAIYYTNNSFYLTAPDWGTVHTDGVVISSSDAATAIFFNDTPNSSNRTVTFSRFGDWSFNPDPGGFQEAFLDTLPTSITVNRGGEFTLPNQLRLNMPNCFFANQYTDIDTASLVKGTTKIVQDPISIGSVNVVLTLDKTDGAYYSEMMTLGVIKGRFRILTSMYNLNTGNWVADHSIQTVAVAQPGVIGGGYSPSGIIYQWNLAGYGSYGTSTPYNASFSILGSIKLVTDSSYSGYIKKDFIYHNIGPAWQVANDALGGYSTGLGQGTVWMDTRVTGNDKKFDGAHLNATPNNAAWCAVIFSEWQELRSPATSSELRDNTIGPPIINNVYDASISGSTAIASSYTIGGPSYRPNTDFYKRNHYYVQSNDPNCWLSSLSVGVIAS